MSEFDIFLLMTISIAFVNGLNEISEKKYFLLRAVTKSWAPMLIVALLGTIVRQLSEIIQLM